MNTSRLSILLLALPLAAFTACDHDSEASKKMNAAAADAKAAASKAGESMKAGFEEMRAKFSQEAEPKMAALEKKIDELKAKASTMSGDAKMKLEKLGDDLAVKRDELKQMLANAKTQTEAGWNAFTEKFSSGVKSLEEKANEALKSN